MVFNVSLLSAPGGTKSKKVFVCWEEKNSYYIKSILGHFQYYQFLKTVFSDFSSEMRGVSLEFYKPGDGKECVTWTLKEGLSENNFSESILNGLTIINNEVENYRFNYGIYISFRFKTSKNDSKGTTIEGTINKVISEHSDMISA